METDSDSDHSASSKRPGEDQSAFAGFSKQPKMSAKVTNKPTIKRKRVCLTVSQKIEICKVKVTNPNIKNNRLALQYGVGEATTVNSGYKNTGYKNII